MIMSKRKTTQENRVLEYMQKFGGITTRDAFNDLGITRLSAKIFNLKKQGYDIISEYKQAKNRFGETTYFKKYMLKQDEIEAANGAHIPTI